MNLPKLVRFYLVKSKLINVGPGLLQHSIALTTVSFSGSVCISTSATTAAAVASLSSQLSTKCMPSVAMIVEIILESKNFKQAVKEQVAPEFNVLDERAEKMDEKIEELQKLFFSLCSVHAICP